MPGAERKLPFDTTGIPVFVEFILTMIMKNTPSPFTNLLSLCAGLSLALGAGHAFAADAKVDMSDKTFITDAYEAGLAEIHAGTMADSKSTNPDVKAFGEHMVTDHTKANEELKTIAMSKNVDVPTSPSIVQQAKAKVLDLKSGASFDSSFADTMVSDHKKVIKAFGKEAKEGDDADLKAFAAKTLPTLKMHLKMAEELDAKVSK